MESALAMDSVGSVCCNKIVLFYTSVGVERIHVARIVSTAVRDMNL